MFEGFESAESKPSYQVLARRTRPQAFSELVGQEVVAKALEGMLASQKIPHAFLFTGTRGTGKTSSARILAKSICCVNGPTATPCQTCVHCVQITACAHEDVLEIDGASNTGVDNIRELRESARFYPNSSRYKIFIIDEVHMLSIGAFNALLKTLEEPPPQVHFILATTELHKVPVTVRSRCMIFSFRKVDTETISQHLKNILTQEQVTFEDDALLMVAREAKGSLRDSLSLLEQVLALGGGKHVSTETARMALSVMGEEIAENLFAGILARDAQHCLEFLRSADAASLDMATVLENTAGMFRAALLIKDARDETKAMRLAQLLPAEFQKIRTLSAGVSTAALSEIFRTLSLASKDLGRTNAQLAWAELAILDCVSRADWLSSGELLALLAASATGGSFPAPAGHLPSAPSASPHSLPSVREAAPHVTLPPANFTPSATLPSTAVPAAAPVSVGSTGFASVPESSARTSAAEKVDMQGFARLVAIIERRSLGLATKLKHASLDAFHPRLVQFADIPQNRVYTQMTEPDARLFVEALKECGFECAELKGVELPKGVHWRAAVQPAAISGDAPNGTRASATLPASTALNTTVNATAQASIAPQMAPHSRPAGGVSFLDKIARSDVFAEPEAPALYAPQPSGAAEKKNSAALASLAGAQNAAPRPTLAPLKGAMPQRDAVPAASGWPTAVPTLPQAAQPLQASLADMEKAHKQKEFLLREEKVRNLAPIRKLADLATRLEFLPYEGEETPER